MGGCVGGGGGEDHELIQFLVPVSWNYCAA